MINDAGKHQVKGEGSAVRLSAPYRPYPRPTARVAAFRFRLRTVVKTNGPTGWLRRPVDQFPYPPPMPWPRPQPQPPQEPPSLGAVRETATKR